MKEIILATAAFASIVIIGNADLRRFKWDGLHFGITDANGNPVRIASHD